MFDLNRYKEQKLIQKNDYSPHYVFNSLLYDKVYEDLHKNFPATELFKDETPETRKHNQRPHHRKYMCIGDVSATPKLSEYLLDINKLPDIWKKFVIYLMNDKEYKLWLMELLDVDDFTFRFDWHKTKNEQDVSPHVDSELKIASHLIYFMPKSWECRNGGKTIFYSGKKVQKLNPEYYDFEESIEIDNIGNKSCLFKNSEHGWHGITPVKCNENIYRQIFNIVILKKDNKNLIVEKKNINLMNKIINRFVKLLKK